MKRTIIKKIDNYDYVLVDDNNRVYILNIEFYSKYKPMVGDTIYFSEEILNKKNLYAFDEVYNTIGVSLDDIIKVEHDNKNYYFQRRYG